MTLTASDLGVVESGSEGLNSHIIMISKDLTIFGGTEDFAPLFDDVKEAERESGLLYDPLLQVSRQVATQEKNIQDGIANASVADMKPSLTIPLNISQQLLEDLRTGGDALRTQMSKSCRDNFSDLGLWSADEPSLTFQESVSAPHVLWDLVYDGNVADEAKWKSFWGFRLPIAHWVMLARDRRPRIRERMFGGLHEALPFAVGEIADVAALMECKTRTSVSDLFRGYVKAALIASPLSESDAESWLRDREEDWLVEFLMDGPGKPARSEPWIKARILEMLHSLETDFDLLHFACHSASDAAVASRFELTMKVGGQELTFNVGSMKDPSDTRPRASTPGPIVFLNACRPAAADQPFQRPPFATSWIMNRKALAVISAICPVPDFFAREFALKFYDFLLGNTAADYCGTPVKGWLSGSFFAARRYFMQEHNNPLGLAYVLYATQDSRLAPTVRESMQ